MNRILAIDIGLKRCGLAVTDGFVGLASGLTTVSTNHLIPFLLDYIPNESVKEIVIGEPKKLNNTPSESADFVAQMVAQISTKFPSMTLHRVDERFTSKMAQRTLIDSGVPKAKRSQKGLIDEISATLILQSHLEKTQQL